MSVGMFGFLLGGFIGLFSGWAINEIYKSHIDSQKTMKEIENYYAETTIKLLVREEIRKALEFDELRQRGDKK